MGRPQLIRRLRIAVSVFFAAVAVALCVLWVRSYCGIDAIWYKPSDKTAFRLLADRGAVIPTAQIPRVMGDPPPLGWSIRHYNSSQSTSEALGVGSWRSAFRGFYCSVRRQCQSPYWLLTLLAIAGAVAPWTKPFNRFSLRAMLIATTLVAIVPGLGVWLAGVTKTSRIALPAIPF